ncbi:MAG: DUF6089 family protein [Ferruginibacter sp.]
MRSFNFCRFRYLALSLVLLSGLNSRSQNLFASIYVGSSNYSGELQEKRFTFTQSHPAGGVGLLYEINEKMFIRGDFTFGKIGAHDKFGKNKARNLSFFSNIYEYSIGFEYVLFDPYIYKVSPYFFTGICLFDFNPHTKDANGNIVLLAERSTEGEGFIAGKDEYKLRDFSIPIGGGIMWAINANKRLGIVLGFRKTFTDYLDDVSTTYVDQTLLALNRGQSTADIAYRGDELPNGPVYPPAGTRRGNPKTKDWYYFSGISFRIRILPKGRAIKAQFDSGRRKRARTDCPVNVY